MQTRIPALAPSHATEIDASSAWRSAVVAHAAPVLLAALLAIAYVAVAPYSTDLASHTYRAVLFDRAGLTVWNNGWFAGHHTPGYSVLFPALASLLGVRPAGAVAAVAAAGLFAVVARDRWGESARAGSLWFAAGSATLLLTGRLAFALGVAVGLGALLALGRRRTGLAAGLAVACALASPVAALFLALAGTAQAVAGERRGAGLALAGAALGSIAAMAALFPEGGDEPFKASAYLAVPALAAFALYALPRGERVLRAGAVLYALGCTAAVLIPTPVGGNSARLGALVGGPLLACALWPQRRRAAFAVALVPLVFWQWTAAAHDVVEAAGDPSVHAAYYAPLKGFLARAGGPPARIEIPPTRHHTEAAQLATSFPIARGWERQLDRRYNRVFYEPGLTPARYRAWLRQLGVRWVALPDVELDVSGTAEARLLRAGMPGLRPVWRGRHWRVWEVSDFRGLASGRARLVRLGPTDFTLHASAAGSVRVAIHDTPWWTVVAGHACVTGAPDGWTRVRVRAPGTIVVAARLSSERALSDGPSCHP